MTRRTVIAGLMATAALPLVAGCRNDGGEENREDDMLTPTQSSTQAPVDLPPPVESTVPVDVALRRRRSVREFTDDPLTRADMGQLLWAAQGVTADWGGRTAPSAGALYPLELYGITAEGAHRYLPVGHRTETVHQRDLRPELMAAALDQEAIAAAPLVVAVIVVPDRTAATYGDRARRYVDLEAGHATQNLLLQAVALDLAAVTIGAFDDRAVTSVLDLASGHEPRYLVPVGRAR
jgi:SagB-type dehydrogenase family enzyme